MLYHLWYWDQSLQRWEKSIAGPFEDINRAHARLDEIIEGNMPYVVATEQPTHIPKEEE